MPEIFASPVPRGIIMVWSGSVASIPAGWLICDGTNGTPDLRDRFVIGAGGALAVGDTGGSATHTHGVGSLASGAASAGTPVTAGATSVGTSTHTHPITGTSAAGNGRPPYYALAFIQKA